MVSHADRLKIAKPTKKKPGTKAGLFKFNKAQK